MHGAGTAPAPCRSERWAWFDTLPEKKKAEARARLEALDTIDTLVRAGVQTVVATVQVGQRTHVSASTIYRWRDAVAGLDRADWLPALAPRHAGRVAEVECPAEAWEVLKADYLRPEKPNFSDCFRRLESVAKGKGWALPSASTLQRRIDAIPVELRVLARDGVDALKRMYPAQERRRDHFHALEAVNADGHKWDVFVRWPDGHVGRPQMVAIQDLYSGMLLSWRVDKTANKEAVRLAIGDVVEEFGLFSACWLDNGRDFASKWITGGTPNRYRFKVTEEEPSGLLTQLGVAVHWTTPYSGQSKPIERAFRDMAQSVSKHPRFAGAYVGNKPDAKPENYGTAAVPLDVFLATIGGGHRRAQCADRPAQPRVRRPAELRAGVRRELRRGRHDHPEGDVGAAAVVAAGGRGDPGGPARRHDHAGGQPLLGRFPGGVSRPARDGAVRPAGAAGAAARVPQRRRLPGFGRVRRGLGASTAPTPPASTAASAAAS